MPSFMRFFGNSKTTLLSVLSVFILFNAHAVVCPDGYEPQENVFKYDQDCTGQNGRGYPFYGDTKTNSPISKGDGTWIAYFSSFRVKGRAYCSDTVAPTEIVQRSTCGISRRPTATSIDTTKNSGTHCWCQATEHQAFSTGSRGWSTPFQKIYTDYVYFKDMGESCADQCAAYCSYMATNLILDGSVNNVILGDNLRASIYDSIHECKPVENRITYKSDNDIVDYQYYTPGALKIKDSLEKNNFTFKGWCETPGCTNPIVGGSTKPDWSGEKTLYAEWERSGCETGVKSEINSKSILTCTSECEAGYEKQNNPFPASNSSYCGYNGNGGDVVKATKDWIVYYSSYSYNFKGHSFCSPTKPAQTDLQNLTKDKVCQIPLHPMLEDIDTEHNGNHCWCQVTEYDILSIKNPQTIPLDAKYVYVGEVSNCSGMNGCAALCSDMGTSGHYKENPSTSTGYISLRTSVYNSIKQCVKGTYTLTLKNGDNVQQTFPDYSVSDEIELPTPTASVGQEGYEFVGWCEDLNNCDNPLTGTQSGLYGTKTLYAKWIAKTYEIEYSLTDGSALSKSTPMIYTVDTPVTLKAPIVEDGYEFEAWVNEDTGEEITVLPTESIKSGTVRLAARVSKSSSSGGDNPSGSGPEFSSTTPYNAPATCDAGYALNSDSNAVLAPQKDTTAKLSAFISDDGDYTALTCDKDATTASYSGACPATDWIPSIKIANEKNRRLGFALCRKCNKG